MVIESNLINNVSTILEVSKTKEQIEQENYEKLETPEALFKRLGYLYPKPKKKYLLNNGLVIKNRRQYIKKTYICEKILAFDTETHQGECKLIACSGGKYLLNPTFLQCIKFLFYLADKPHIYRFLYNLDFDFSSILKLWNSNIKVLQKRILRKITCLKNGIEVKYKDYLLKWIKGRMISISHITRKKSVIITDIFNFFSIGLNKSSEKYLNEVKIDTIDGNLLNTSLDYWKKNEKDIIKYCIQDCILTQKLGKLLINTIEKNNIPLPKYLVSSASISKQIFRLKCFIPNISHIPKKIMQISYDSYYGGRFEIFKRGYFKSLFLYDINSQYPFFIKNLPNLRDGVWKKTLKIPKKPCLAYYLVSVNIPKDYLIPTIPINHNGINKFPNGKITKWCTWFDIDLIRDYITTVHKGYIFIPTEKNYKPFTDVIDLLFQKKQKLKGIKGKEFDYNINKIGMNALYGCFIETHKNYVKDTRYNIKDKPLLNSGILFNPVYASQITAFGRWSVIKDIPKDKYQNVIAIHTDSIISNIKFNGFFTLNLELGNWNKEKFGKGIVLNTGMYQIDDLIKTRGIPKKFIKNWFSFCKKYKFQKIKKFNIKHMRKLSEGLIRDKSLEYVNTICDDTRSVNCNSDSKRHWIKPFINFKEVLTTSVNSYPYYCFDTNILDLNPLTTAYQVEYALKT